MTRSHEETNHPEIAEREMSPALRAMVDELRTEAAPDLRWDAMERRLLDRIGRGEGGRFTKGRPPGAAFQQLAGFAAAAALLALFVSAGGDSPDTSIEQKGPARVVDVRAVAPPLNRRGDRDLAALRPGDAVETGDRSIAFARPGDVRFTLAAGSRAVIKSSSEEPLRTVVELERGAIRAEVVPRNPAEGIVEAFIVEAGGTRIAVRGTAFSVERADDSIHVDVEHGTVAVGPAGREGVLVATSLVGPARARFSLSGVRLETLAPGMSALFDPDPPTPGEPTAFAPDLSQPGPDLSQPGPDLSPPGPDLSPPGPDLSQPSHDLPAPARDLPAPARDLPAPARDLPAPARDLPAPARDLPAPDLPAPLPPSFLTSASIKAGVERCFHQTYSSRQTQVKLSIASTLRIQVRADGTVQSAVLNPPLEPSFQLCVGSAIAGRFKTGPQTVTIPVSIGR